MMAYSGTGPCLRLDALAHSAACSSRHAPASGSRLHPQEVLRGARTSASASSLDCSGSVMHRSNTLAAALLTVGASTRDAESAAAAVANLQLVVANFCFYFWGRSTLLLSGGLGPGDTFPARRPWF